MNFEQIVSNMKVKMTTPWPLTIKDVTSAQLQVLADAVKAEEDIERARLSQEKAKSVKVTRHLSVVK